MSTPETIPTKEPRFEGLPDRGQRLPRGAGKFGMALFLISLGMLFAASIVGFIVIRAVNLRGVYNPKTEKFEVDPNVIPLGDVEVPGMLWLSTFLMLISSVTIHSAVDAVRRERQLWLRRWLVVTGMLAAGFLLVQAPSLAKLLAAHFDADTGTGIFGLIFALIIIHALHVVGGVVPLVWVTLKAFAGRYDHEYHTPITYTAMYWHFLDGIWLVMFAVLLVAT